MIYYFFDEVEVVKVRTAPKGAYEGFCAVVVVVIRARRGSYRRSRGSCYYVLLLLILRGELLLCRIFLWPAIMRPECKRFPIDCGG